MDHVQGATEVRERLVRSRLLVALLASVFCLQESTAHARSGWTAVDGTEPDTCEASLTACKSGDSHACIRGADWLITRPEECPRGAPAGTRALSCYQRACDLSLAAGCVAAGEMLASGLYVPVRASESARAYERARLLLTRECKDGQGKACTTLSALVDHHLVSGTPRDADEYFQRGIGLLSRECGGGSAAACVLTAELLKAAPRDRQDRSSMLEAWDHGCQQGEGSACVALADSGHVPADRARTLIKRGCDLGNAGSCASLGKLEQDQKDWQGAAEALQRACSLGLCWSCRELAELLEAGRAVPAYEGQAEELRHTPCPYVREGQVKE
jgi:TPR repeat protein